MNQADFMTLVDKYILSKRNSWADSTKNSARGHLASVGPVAMENDGDALYKHLTVTQGLKPYSVKTYFVRAGDFLAWAMDSGELPRSFNNVKLFMKHNARLFKRVYAPKQIEHTLDDVLAKLKNIEDAEVREKAGQLLRTGMRWEESFTLTPDGYVTGKGNARRLIRTATPEDASIPFTKTYATFVNHLREVGLKPHDLRKAHALWLAESGAHIGEMMAFMGWRSVQSAASYIQNAKERELTAKLRLKFKKGSSE